MPGPTPVHVEGDAALPDAVDVVVIGGGIVGTSTALELSERGLKVALCEKGGIAHEQSSRNWGWVRISRRDPREVPLMNEALRLWKGMDERIGRATGYTRAGIVFVCGDERELADHDRWRRHLEPYQYRSRMLSRQELDEMAPGGELKGVGALFTPEDGRAEPQMAAPAIAEAARERGAAVLTGCAVRTIETAGGAVSGVVTERGPIACSAVVLAGGMWSGLFAGNLGLELPQLGVVSHVLRTEPVEGGPERAVWTDRFAIRKRADGGHTISRGSGNTVDIVPNSFRYARKYLSAFRMQHRDLHFRLGSRFLHEARRKRRWGPDERTPFEEERVIDPAPSERMTRSLLQEVGEAFPALRKARVAQSWAGCIDVTPDAIPVISGVETIPGLFLGTGFSGHGFGIGPGAGLLLADLVTNAAPCVDPTPFRFSRFTDGSRVAPDTGF